MIGGKRGIGTAFDQEMRDAGVIRAHPMHEQQDKLVEGQTEQEGEAGGEENMPVMLLIGPPPPLSTNCQQEKRNADRRNPDHRDIEQLAPSGDAVECMR